MNELGGALLAAARGAISASFGGDPPGTPPELPELSQLCACFVTLHAGVELRGCVGNVQAESPLWEAVQHNARAAAFRDPRFPPLMPGELAEVSISVSVLSPLELVAAASEDALAQALHLPGGGYGVVLRWQGLSATFLPQMWERMPDAGEFLLQLRRKGGMPIDRWPAGLRAYRFTAEEHAEE